VWIILRINTSSWVVILPAIVATLRIPMMFMAAQVKYTRHIGALLKGHLIFNIEYNGE
jgi:hypothetical protein